MMQRWQLSVWIVTGMCLIFIVGAWQSPQIPAHTAAAAEEQRTAAAEPEPVEEDDHEFMEYVFEPPFDRVKKALAAEPQEKSVWRGIKADGLTLAESANLLLLRESAGEQLWDQPSIQVRNDAAKLYAAARKADYAAAREAFKAMTASCNRCHEEYGGEDLEP